MHVHACLRAAHISVIAAHVDNNATLPSRLVFSLVSSQAKPVYLVSGSQGFC